MGGKNDGIFGLIFSFISVLLGLLLAVLRGECNSILFCLKPFDFSTHLLSPYSVHLLHNENSLCSLYGIIIIFVSCSFSLCLLVFNLICGGGFPCCFIFFPLIQSLIPLKLYYSSLPWILVFIFFQYHHQSRICFCAVCLLLILII